MTPERLKFFRYMLQQKIHELLGEAEKTVSEMTNVNDKFPDPNDLATFVSDRTFELRIRDRERKLIGKLQDAIKRIDDKIYGICETCGEQISEKRLLARPMTTHCIDCKSKLEKLEKRMGD